MDLNTHGTEPLATLSCPSLLDGLDWVVPSIKPFQEASMDREQWLHVATGFFEQHHGIRLEGEALSAFRSIAPDVSFGHA